MYRVTTKHHLFSAAEERSRWGRFLAVDYAVVEFLNQLDQHLSELPDTERPLFLLSLRDDFRKVITDRPSAGLRTWLAKSGRLGFAGPVAVMLIGKYATPTKNFGLAELATGKMSRSFARQLAKVARRVRAWSVLRRLVHYLPDDPYISRQLDFDSRSDFHQRLRKFAQHIDASYAPPVEGPSQMPLWFSSEFWLGHPARTAAAIRAVLERIHRLVRG